MITPCPYDPTIPNVNNDNCTKPVVVCKVVDAEVNLTTRTVNFRTSIDSTNPANTTIFSYVYDFGDDSALITKQSAALTDTQSHTYEAGSYTASVRINYATTGTDGRQETTCSTPIDFEADKPLGQAKTVKNVTQNLTGADAEDSIVKAGDVLEYTLSTSNTQNYERRDILISDYIGDVLDYGTLDISALEASGGSFDKEKSKISWRNVTIPANGVVQSVFRVTILDPVPATNRPSATSGDFDCSITNVYGDSTTLDIQCPVVKGIETLPNTGPGTSMIALTGITGVVGYFFARSRLLAKELQLIRTDYAVTGGM